MANRPSHLDFNGELSYDYSNNTYNPKISLRSYCHSQGQRSLVPSNKLDLITTTTSSTSSSSSSTSSSSYSTPVNEKLNQQQLFHTYQYQNGVGDYSPTTPPSDSELSTSMKKKKRCNLPKKTTKILMDWLNSNINNPYPNTKEKFDLIMKTGLTNQQLSNWFINARRRKIHNLKENQLKMRQGYSI